MSLQKKKTLADQIADLDLTAPKEYDPEDLTEPVNDRTADDLTALSDGDDEKAREHYVKVGKSSLRNQQQFVLDDPRYAGQRTSRKELFSEDESMSDEELGSDDEQELSDEEQPESDEEQVSEDEEPVSDEEDQNDEEMGEQSSESAASEESQSEPEEDENSADLRQQLRRLQEEEKAMISKLSQRAQSDIEKGQHVRQQLALWENFLESRIRVQKVVELSNQLPQHDVWPEYLAKEEGVETDLDAAKNELRGIMDDLIDLRVDMLKENDAIDFENRTWNSRKRHLEDDDEYIENLWKDISEINDVFLPFRNSTLQKWSDKVQVASGVKLNKKFKAFDQNIMTQLNNILADKESLVRRTQLQRTEYKVLGKPDEAPVDREQDAKAVDRHLSNYDTEIFDDNDFYQQLLKELIEARMVDTDDPIALGMRWAARKAAESKKKKRVVERKTSKDRKLRFNVHEKLQNFMVPIPTGTWHEEMTDELFTSLLGHRKTTLDETAA